MTELFTPGWIEKLNQELSKQPLTDINNTETLELCFQILDNDNEFTYHVVIGDKVKFVAGSSRNPVPIIVTDKETAIQMHFGKLSISEAITGGKIKLKGDLSKLVGKLEILENVKESLLKVATNANYTTEVDNPMEILSSRILLRPTNLERSLNFYGNDLGLAVYREFGVGNERGIVFFLGGGFLELSGRSGTPAGPNVSLWLQVRDVEAAYQHLVSKGVLISKRPKLEPWGLKEMWVNDPDGVRLYIVEVPENHPLRKRVDE